MAKDLSVKAVKVVKAGETRQEIPDGHTRGLFLIVQPSGTKSWALRYRLDGVPKKLTIGPVLEDRGMPVAAVPLGAPHTLSEARAAAQALKLIVASGGNPSAKPEPSDCATATVRTVADRFHKEHRKRDGSPLRESSLAEIKRQFNAYIFPSIGDRPIADVSGDEVRSIVQKRRSEGRDITANRVHATLSAFFKWCCHKDWRILPSNPYADYAKPCGERSRDRALSWAEVAALWHLAGSAGQPFGPIVRLLLLTGQRRSEVTGMHHNEIDGGQGVWTIPASRAKNGKAHTVPLTAQALAELATVKRIGGKGLVFTTNGEVVYVGHQKAKYRLDAQLQFNTPWRLHDIRRTVATGMAELGEPVHIVEAVLNHQSGTVSGIAAVYNVHTYAEEKRHALEAWARFVVDVVTVEPVRLAYGRLRDRRRFRDAIHGPDARWRRYVALLARWQRFTEHVARLPSDMQEAA